MKTLSTCTGAIFTCHTIGMCAHCLECHLNWMLDVTLSHAGNRLYCCTWGWNWWFNALPFSDGIISEDALYGLTFRFVTSLLVCSLWHHVGYWHIASRLKASRPPSNENERYVDWLIQNLRMLCTSRIGRKYAEVIAVETTMSVRTKQLLRPQHTKCEHDLSAAVGLNLIIVADLWRAVMQWFNDGRNHMRSSPLSLQQTIKPHSGFP